MLETVREFALEHLTAAGEELAVRHAHAGAMLTLTEAAAPHLEGPEQGVWMDRLEVDHANTREAIKWLQDQGRIDDILRLGARIRWFWFQFHPIEAGLWLEDALADAESVPWNIRADALHAAGHLARSRADRRRAAELHNEELRLRQAAGDEAGLGRLLLTLGIEATERGDPSAATPYLQEALDRLRDANDAWAVGLTLSVSGDVARFNGDLDGAVQRYEEAAQIQRGTGETHEYVLTLINMAVCAHATGKA